MGGSSSKPIADPTPTAVSAGGGCPMRQKDPSKVPQQPPEQSSQCPMRQQNSSTESANVTSKSQDPLKDKSDEGRCPMRKYTDVTKYRNPHVYNVYSQPIDPTNQMPTTANQNPAPNQKVVLPVERVQSSIPKGGTDDGTWLYPSPQMFWNALVRKNKVEGANEDDMETVVAVHNNMNESTWTQVMAWEALHPVKSGHGTEPKLLRFLGRPDELSPKARLKVLVAGHPAPFDRHDWVVDRGGEEVRYIIDYYHDESAVDKDQKPKHLKDFGSVQSIKVDVRPALDSFDALVDRILKMPYEKLTNGSAYDPPPFFPPSEMKKAEESKGERLAKNWSDIQIKCVDVKNKMKECKSEEECGAASVALQKCIASVVCPSVADEFDQCAKAKPVDNAKISTAYSSVVKCIDLFELDSKQAKATTTAK